MGYDAVFIETKYADEQPCQHRIKHRQSHAAVHRDNDEQCAYHVKHDVMHIGYFHVSHYLHEIGKQHKYDADIPKDTHKRIHKNIPFLSTVSEKPPRVFPMEKMLGKARLHSLNIT